MITLLIMKQHDNQRYQGIPIIRNNVMKLINIAGKIQHIITIA